MLLTAVVPLMVAPLLVPAHSVAGVAASGSAVGDGKSGPKRPPKREPKPDPRANVLLITTDDQTLSDLQHMPRTRRLIGARGVTFDGISPHPLCCPARAEILTGQFAQNNGVRSNVGEYGGYKRLRTRNTLATWLNRAGYHTMFMGKFLNGYGPRADRGPAPGWDDWNPTVRGVYKFHRFSVRHNRRVKRYRGRYQTDVFTDLAAQKIRAASKRRAPFFLWQSYVAPHVACSPAKETEACWAPPVAAARHRGMFRRAVPPSMRSDAFNEEDTTDKPFPAVAVPEVSDSQRSKILRLHRRRLQSLQAVDEGIARMIAVLQRTREMKNTVVIFTSDNGYLLGEHRYTGKVLPYEPAVRVPLLMRGPGLPHGVVRNRIGTLVDLAPTIAAIARARPRLVMDGRNLWPIAKRNARSWETLLIQAGQYRPRDAPYGWFYRGVRTGRYTYAHYPYSEANGYQGSELYDRRRDPHQLENLASDPRYAPVLRALRKRTRALEDCAGRTCRRSFKRLPSPLPALPDESPDDGGSQPPPEEEPVTPDPPSEPPSEDIGDFPNAGVQDDPTTAADTP
jgi:N-acetylglucosamine-6-sulfatase